MPPKETGDRILDFAERLFAEKGFVAASLRTVTARAKVNLASVHYHFGSKQELIETVLLRRLKPLNQERLQLLDQAETAAGSAAVPLESILRALIAPMMKMGNRHPYFVRVAGRVHSEPNKGIQNFFLQQFQEVIARFMSALARTVPELPIPEMMWRMHFLIGSIIHTWTNHHILEKISAGACNLSDIEAMTERLVIFGCAGLRAPLPVANEVPV